MSMAARSLRRLFYVGVVAMLAVSGCAPPTPCDEVHGKVVSCGFSDSNDVFNIVYKGECKGVKLCAAQCHLNSDCPGFTNGQVTSCQANCER